MTSEPALRIGVVGAGAFAAACHLPGLLRHPGARVVAICGRRPQRAAEVAARFGIAAVGADAAELVARSDVDAVTICTPNAAHREAAVLAFQHGKHVFCEKPLAAALADAQAMAAAAQASGRVHQVAFTYRYLHGVGELRRRVRAGDVGEPFLFRVHHEFWDGLRPGAPIGWRELRQPAGGGVLYDSGSHFFDLARFVLGPIAAVRADLQHVPRRRREAASGETRDVETDDRAACWFRFASGVHGEWHASRVTPPRAENSVVVVGREGALAALLSRGRLDGLRAARPGEAEWEELPLPAEAGDGEAHALWRMMGSFVDACRRGSLAEADASFADGLAAQRAIAAAEAAADSGWARLEPPA